MCEFISWIEKDGNVLFLTYNDIYNTKRGKELQEYTIPNDYIGHGAIRFYYDLTNGENKECTDFSTPDNFPPEIAEAIKDGRMRGLGIAEELLSEPAYAEYRKIEQAACAEYRKIQQSAYAEYRKIEQAAYAEYVKIQQSAYAEYVKIEQAAYAEYRKIEQAAFWDLFADIKNRVEAWK